MKDNIIDSYKLYLKNMFNFKGRASRSNFWYVVLVNAIISFLIRMLLFMFSDGNNIQIFVSLISLLISLSMISLFVRRLHDIGKSGFCYFVHFIPIVSYVFYFVWYTRDSQKGTNKYGPNPKEPLDMQSDVSVLDKDAITNKCKVCGAIFSEDDVVCPKCGCSVVEEKYYG